MRKWIKSFGIPDLPEVPDDSDVRQKLAADAKLKQRMVAERDPEIRKTVKVAQKHLSRNHYSQRLFEAYGGNPQ